MSIRDTNQVSDQYHHPLSLWDRVMTKRSYIRCTGVAPRLRLSGCHAQPRDDIVFLHQFDDTEVEQSSIYRTKQNDYSNPIPLYYSIGGAPLLCISAPTSQPCRQYAAEAATPPHPAHSSRLFLSALNPESQNHPRRRRRPKS